MRSVRKTDTGLRTDVESRKTVLMKPCGRAGIEMQLERSDLWTQWGRGGVGRTTSSADVYTLPRAKQVPRGELPSSTGAPRRALGCGVDGREGEKLSGVPGLLKKCENGTEGPSTSFTGPSTPSFCL